MTILTEKNIPFRYAREFSKESSQNSIKKLTKFPNLFPNKIFAKNKIKKCKLCSPFCSIKFKQL